MEATGMSAPCSKVCVPLLLEPGEKPSVSKALVEVLARLEPVLLGYFIVPDQTALDQAREKYEEEGRENLLDICEAFEEEGCGELTTRLVFTHDEAQTIERVANEEECDTVLVPAPAEKIERVLVPLRGKPNVDRILNFVKELVREDTVEIKLLNVAGSRENESAMRLMLEGAKEELSKLGVDPSLVRTEVAFAQDVSGEIAGVSRDYDVLVMGETEPSVKSLVFGEMPERVERKAQAPVIVVKGEGDRRE